MHITFSKVIKVDDKCREFNFRKLSDEAVLRYHVDVTDDKGNRLIFNLSKTNDNSWEAVETALPNWLHGTENLIGKIIEEETFHFMASHSKLLKK